MFLVSFSAAPQNREIWSRSDTLRHVTVQKEGNRRQESENNVVLKSRSTSFQTSGSCVMAPSTSAERQPAALQQEQVSVTRSDFETSANVKEERRFLCSPCASFVPSLWCVLK